MDYNAILRNSNSSDKEKRQAFTAFFRMYQERGNRFILSLLNRHIPFLPNKTEEADSVYAVTMAKIFDKIIVSYDVKGYLQTRTCEDLFCGITNFDIRNLQRKM